MKILHSNTFRDSIIVGGEGGHFFVLHEELVGPYPSLEEVLIQIDIIKKVNRRQHGTN